MTYIVFKKVSENKTQSLQKDYFLLTFNTYYILIIFKKLMRLIFSLEYYFLKFCFCITQLLKKC